MSGTASFREEVRRFVELQAALLTALHTQHAADLDPRYWLREVPRNGDVTLQGRTWGYFRHGAGFTFIEEGSEREVNAHNNTDVLEYVDAWRLRCYFGSLGRTGVKLIERALGRRGARLYDAAEELLARLHAAGDLIKYESGYRFVADRA